MRVDAKYNAGNTGLEDRSIYPARVDREANVISRRISLRLSAVAELSVRRPFLVQAQTLGEAWILAVSEVLSHGTSVMTEYEESSLDLPGSLWVQTPLKEPRIHLVAYGSWPEATTKYVQEVLEGVGNPRATEGDRYTYHQRLFHYGSNSEDGGFDQVDWMVSRLREAGHTRRAQVTTWFPIHVLHEAKAGGLILGDNLRQYPPCLQRVWCRVVDKKLEMHSHWRSRDIWKAMPLNMLALTDLQREIAARLGVEVGAYMDASDSLHVYERDLEEARSALKRLRARGALVQTPPWRLKPPKTD